MSDIPSASATDLAAARQAAVAAASARGHSLGPFGPPAAAAHGYASTVAQEVAHCTVCGAHVLAAAGLPPVGRALVFPCHTAPAPEGPGKPPTLAELLSRAHR